MIRPKNEPEDLFFSITQNCETFIEQTHRKAEETIEFKPTKPREAFNFQPTLLIGGTWMIGLTSLEVYNSFFKITEKINNSELFKFPASKSGDVSYEKVRGESGKDLEKTDITATALQDDI